MRLTSILATLVAVTFAWSVDASERENTWPAYLDYAYVYVSAEPEALRARLAEYGREGGIELSDFVAEKLDALEDLGQPLGEDQRRRQAIAHLLLFRATGDVDHIEAARGATRELRDRLERRENRWWFHYVRAQHALHTGEANVFSREVFDLWLKVIAELERSYDTHESLALAEASGTGFISALPYLYENLARLIVLETQTAGLTDGLDPLASIVRMLGQSRVGEHPEAIPAEASSAEYLSHITTRLDGAESDGGSLSFTLALFEAARKHDRARTLLATAELGTETQEAVRVTAGAYRDALRLADTLQGQCAVYTRALRQLGELYAAKQRLGVEPDLEVPFNIETAMALYADMHAGLDGAWEDHGYRDAGREAYVDALHGLWEEIQEASFNAAEYYLARGTKAEWKGNESISDAATHFGRYLEFFSTYATPGLREGVPESAYFAAHIAARGVGDAVMSYSAGNPSTTQIRLAAERYGDALELFPFDRETWARVALSLERLGRENDFLAETQSVADAVERSRHLDTWIESGHELAEELRGFRRAVSDDQAIMYLGFAQSQGVEELEKELDALVVELEQLDYEQSDTVERRDELEEARASALSGVSSSGEAPQIPANAAHEADFGQIAELSKKIFAQSERKAELDEQIELRSRALPLFRDALTATIATQQLAGQRDHAVHALLRQLYFENLALAGSQK